MAALLLPLLMSAHAADGASPADPVTEFAFHAVVPLGVEGFVLHDLRQTMYLLASARDPQFEGYRRVMIEGRRTLLDAAGHPVLSYPRDLHFRVTASTRLKLVGVASWPESAGQTANQYMLGLRFRLRIFRGLQQRVVNPSTVKMIGMPADVAYDERVYRVSFQVGELPITDRVVLEVLSPGGKRLSRFHLDLN